MQFQVVHDPSGHQHPAECRAVMMLAFHLLDVERLEGFRVPPHADGSAPEVLAAFQAWEEGTARYGPLHIYRVGEG